jgi:MFS family permease
MAELTPHQVLRRFYVVTYFVGLGGGMTAPFVPVLVDKLGASSFLAGVAVAAVGMSLLVVDLFGSRVIPRLVPSHAIAFGASLFGVGSVISSVASGPSMVIVARLVQGTGAAFFMGASLQVAVRLSPPGRAGAAIGAYNAVWFAGISTGPFLGGAIAALVHGLAGIRLAFALCAGVNLLSAVIALLWLSVPRSPERPALGLPALHGLWRDRVPAVLLLGAAGQGLRGGLALTLVPLFAIQDLGLGGLGVSLVVAVLALTDVTSMRGTTRAADRHGRASILAGTLSLGAVGAALLAVSPGVGQLVLACSLLGVAVGAGWVLPAVMVVDVVDDAVSGLAAFRIVSDIGMVAGGLAAGGLVSHIGGRASFGWAALFLVLLAGLTLGIGETARRLPVTTLEPLPHLVLSQPVAGGDAMSDPHPDLIPVLAAHQGIEAYLSQERLDFAVRVHTALRPKLEALRAVPLSFLEPVIEPATSLAWLERGGQL